MTVRLIVEFTALPGMEADVAQLCVDYAAQVRAEPGNLTFDVFRKANHPEHFYLIEAFADKGTHVEHLASQHRAVFDAALLRMIKEPDMDRTFIEDVTPVPVG